MEQTNPSWSTQLRRRQLAAPVQALVRKNNPSQVAGTDAFKNKGFGALVQAARESQEVFETITADPGNLNKFLEVLAHMIVAAKDEQQSK